MKQKAHDKRVRIQAQGLQVQTLKPVQAQGLPATAGRQVQTLKPESGAVLKAWARGGERRKADPSPRIRRGDSG